ncbi:MAG: hypothetical protein GY765_27845, partial [bacterium]|nr:hypothetical protein [bacterium]
MTQLKDFNIALGVINNILICDKDDNVLFAGDEIKSVLFPEKPVNRDLLENFSKGTRDDLKEKIEGVRKDKNTSQFVIDDLGETIFLFPANYQESEIIIMSTRKQLIRANQIENQLEERVKELECLYGISSELEKTNDLEAALNSSVERLINAFQFPLYTTAYIEVDGKMWGTCECLEAGKTGTRGEKKKQLKEEIIVDGKARGKIEICHHNAEQFLPEEHKLVAEIAKMIGKAIFKNETDSGIEQQRELLVSKNEELMDLTNNLTTINNK